MELHDIKNTWEDISNQVSKKQNLHTDMIDQMTKAGYARRIKKIAYPEFAGVMICLAGAVYIVLHFSRLDTTFLRATGILAIWVLLALSAISMISVRQFSIGNDLNKTYAETLKIFAIGKLRFLKFQRLNILLSYVLLVTVVILFSKLFGGANISTNKYFWIFSFSFGYIFMLFYSRWVLKHYSKILKQAEELLQELN